MNILTFDIEEWFHLLECEMTADEKNWGNFECRIFENTERILDFLDLTNQRATFFCLGWIARKYPQIIRSIDSYGHQIGAHSDLHKLAYKQSKEEFINDLKVCVESIEKITGKKVNSYRAPGFSLKKENKWIFEELINLGIIYDSSIFPVKRAHGGFHEFPFQEPCIIKVSGNIIKEFPINTVSLLGRQIIFSGGGYFRLLPYNLIQYLVKNTNYMMTYFHPRDFDANQPVIENLNFLKKFKSYYGLKNSFSKFSKLIDENEFFSLEEADKNINWEKVKSIHIDNI